MTHYHYYLTAETEDGSRYSGFYVQHGTPLNDEGLNNFTSSAMEVMGLNTDWRVTEITYLGSK